MGMTKKGGCHPYCYLILDHLVLSLYCRNEPLLSGPSDRDFIVPDEILRKTAEYNAWPESENPYIVKDQSFRQQYSNIYFVRLTKLRAAALEAARERWSDLPGTPRTPPLSWHGQILKRLLLEKCKYVSKVLDIQAGMFCYIVGTVYMDMPLKPNILEDITKEVKFKGLLMAGSASIVLMTFFKRTGLSLNHHLPNIWALTPQWRWKTNLEE